MDRDDWRSGGHSVGNEEFYEPSGEEVCDHGGWTGGEFVLGGSSGQGLAGNAGGTMAAGNLSRREILAKAAEERVKKTRQVEDEGEGDGAE